MKIRMTLILALILTIVLGSAAMAAVPPGIEGAPISVGGVTPYVIPGFEGNNSGFRDCDEAGYAFYDDAAYYLYDSGIISRDGAGFAPLPTGVTATYNQQSKLMAWASTFPIGAVLVRNANTTNVYVYDPQRGSDSGLGSTGNAAINTISFCWNPETTEGEWCSPGYWKNHLDAWGPTGYSPDDLFFDALGYYPSRTHAGINAGATTDPTLGYLLDYTNYYGGDDTNAVGDLLSAAHPDVNFLGTRVKDSCPLN